MSSLEPCHVVIVIIILLVILVHSTLLELCAETHRCIQWGLQAHLPHNLSQINSPRRHIY